MAIAGLKGTGQFPPGYKAQNFRERLLMFYPEGTAPFTALTSQAEKMETSTPEFSYVAYIQHSLRLRVNGAHTAAQTTITVDSTDPTSLTGEYYGDPRGLQVGDVLQVEPTSETPTQQPELMRVTGVLGPTQFTVQRGFAGTTAGALADDTMLLRIGNAQPEGSFMPPPVSRDGVIVTNYTQIFRSSFELTGTAAATALVMKDEKPILIERKRMMFDHAEKIEMAFLFGKAWQGVDPTTGQVIRTTGGLRTLIPPQNRTIFSNPITWKALADALRPAFDFATEAGSQRIAFAGYEALSAINQMIAEDTNTSIILQGDREVYGMWFKALKLPFDGVLLIKTHPLMSRHPLYTRSLFVVDFSAVRYRYLKGRDTTPRQNVQPRDKDSYAEEMITECGLELMGGGITCAYLGNIFRN